MVNFIIENFRFLCIAVIVWGITSTVIIPLLKRVREWLRTIIFLKKWYIRKMIIALRFLLLLVIIVTLIELQERYGLIDIGDKANSLGLVISILTVYGILYAFIQFAIGYADQKKNDKYWGKSAIEVLLTRNVEFVIFHSRFFKILLVYSAVFPLVNWEVLPLIESYKSITLAFWEVCITLVYVLYVFLFTKSLFIMKRFFSIQKSPDYSTKWLIEREKTEEYKSLFSYSYQQKNDLFMEVLFKDAMSLEGSESKEMFMKISTRTLRSFSNMQEEKIRRQKSKKTKRELYNLYSMFSYLYKGENLKELGFTFDELLAIYRLTEEVLFNEVKWVANGDQCKFIAELVGLYSNGNNSYKECTYYTVPQIIWDQVRSNDDLLALHRYVETKAKDVRKIIHRAINEESESFLNALAQSEEKYIRKLLDQSKGYLEAVKSRPRCFVFDKYSNENVKNNIYRYILDLEFTVENKAYIEVLMDVLDYKYKVSLVFYILLYPSKTDLIEKQQDVLFFRPLLNKLNKDQQMSDPEVKEFVLWKIGNSDIKHRIGPNLIEWIFENLERRSTDVRLIQSCIDWHYFSYAKLLKFKYIFNEDHEGYLDYSTLEHTAIKQQQMTDWRVEFLKEMLRTPSLFKEPFFQPHIIKLSEHVYKTSTAVDLYGENDFKLFYMNPFFEMTEVQFWRLLEEKKYLRKGILEFLILKLDKAPYDYLFANERIVELFKRRVTEIIYETNLDIESYVNQLAERANEVRMDSPVSQLKKDKIVRKLIDHLYE